jgi:hypothetical protein
MERRGEPRRLNRYRITFDDAPAAIGPKRCSQCRLGCEALERRDPRGT